MKTAKEKAKTEYETYNKTQEINSDLDKIVKNTLKGHNKK